MGLFEDILSMMEKKKNPQPSVQPIGYQVPAESMVDPMQDPRIQQEMMRDPTLAERIRQYMIQQRIRNSSMPTANPSATIGLRG